MYPIDCSIEAGVLPRRKAAPREMTHSAEAESAQRRSQPPSATGPASPTPPARTAGIAAHGSSATRPCRLEILLDEGFRIPGTQFRFGLDGIIGLVPGLGDVLAGLLSLIIPVAAWIRGVPYVTLVRMAANLGIGVLVGSIPIFGDIFDIAWKANRRNYRLLQRHLGEPRRHTWRDWVFCCCWAVGAGAGVCHSRGARGLVSDLARLATENSLRADSKRALGFRDTIETEVVGA
jgi:hypothetical protein